jgi:GntR family transcriptional regulator
MSAIESSASQPRHEQVSEWLRGQIEQGVYRPGDRLPSETELGEQFGVSRITVRRALHTLESDELIFRRHGLGTFVKRPRVRQGLVRLTDFAQDMERAGMRPSSRILFYAPVKAEGTIAATLQLEPNTTVMRLDRLRLGDGEPIALDLTWLPLFYAQLLEGHDLEHETIYHILERDYDIPVLRGRYRIEAVNAEQEIADALGVEPGTALLVIERTSLTLADRRIYFQRRYYRSDRVAYEMELERNQQDVGRTEGMPLREFEPVFKAGS